MTDAEKLRRAIDEHIFVGDAGAVGMLLVDEVKRLRAERDQVLAMFSKFTHRGPLNMPRDFHLSRGRRMAGLPAEGGDTP